MYADAGRVYADSVVFQRACTLASLLDLPDRSASLAVAAAGDSPVECSGAPLQEVYLCLKTCLCLCVVL